MTADKSNERKHKRFSLKNALIGFPGKDNRWGKINDISRGGFKLSTKELFEKGVTLSVLIDFRSIPDQALFPNLFEIKVKIIWKYSPANKNQVDNTYGVSFTDLDKTETDNLNSLFENLDRSEKLGDDDVDNMLLEIDSYLEQFRK